MPAFGENQAFAVHVQDSLPQVRVNRRRNRSVLETTMVFRTAGDSATRVRAENASGIRISVTGPKPGESDLDFEATAYGRSSYNVRTAVTITHHDVNLALDARRPRPLVKFVSVGPISEADLCLAPGETPPPYPLDGTSKPAHVKVKARPISAPAPAAETVRAMLDAPPTKSFVPARPTSALRIVTNPLEGQHDADSDSPVDSPLNSPLLAFRPHQFSGGRSVEPLRFVLDEPLPSLCPRTPSEDSFTENVVPEEVEQGENPGPTCESVVQSSAGPDADKQTVEQGEESPDRQSENSLAQCPSSEILSNESSVANIVEDAVSPVDSAQSHITDRLQRSGKVISLTKAVKLKLYGPRATDSSSTLPLGRSSMSPPPSAFQRFERSLGGATGSSASLSSHASLKNVNAVAGSSSNGKGMKALLGKAMGIGKGIKRSREEEENVSLEDSQDGNDRPIAGRRTKRKLMGISVGP